jgi:hypothetical protein
MYAFVNSRTKFLKLSSLSLISATTREPTKIQVERKSASLSLPSNNIPKQLTVHFCRLQDLLKPKIDIMEVRVLTIDLSYN